MRDKIFLNISIIFFFITVIHGGGEGVLKKEHGNTCPNLWKINKLRGEFVAILHLIEKQEIGQETGWKKFGKFLTFLAPKKRMETVDDFCSKIDSERDQPKQRWFRKVRSSNYAECLDKIFWTGNAELVKLKKPSFFTGLIYNMYNESAKMFEGMLKPREQLMAELFYAAINPGRGGRVDTDVLMELLLGRSKEELSATISKYNEMYKSRHRNHLNGTQLLVDMKNFCRKLPENSSPTKKTCKFMEERIGAIAHNSEHNMQEVVGNIFKKCEDWAIWKQQCCVDNHCTNCGLPFFTAAQKQYAWHGEQIILQIKNMNQLLTELLVYLKLGQMFERNFSTNFSSKCEAFIDYMHNPQLSRINNHSPPTENAASPIKTKSWFRRSNNAKKAVNVNVEPKEVEPRENFAQIKKMLEISGLYFNDSRYKYLAQKLKEANLTGNYQTVQRIVDMHVGVDMLKILDHYAEGVAGVLKDSTTKNGQASTFNAMFTAAYLNVLNNLSNKCYVSIEQGHLQRFGTVAIDGSTVKKKVKFSVPYDEKPESSTTHIEGEEAEDDGTSLVKAPQHNDEEELQNNGPKRLQPIDEDDELLQRLDYLMQGIQLQIDELIIAQENGLVPADHGKGKAENCELDDDLFGQFMMGTDIKPELLSRGGPDCLKMIKQNLAERRSKLKKPKNGALKIGEPEQDNISRSIPNNLKPIKTSYSQRNEGIIKDNMSRRDNSPKRLTNSPTKSTTNVDDSVPTLDSSPRKLNDSSPKKDTKSPPKARTKDNDILPKLDISQRTGKSDNSPKRTENSPRKEFGSPRKLNDSPPKKGANSPPKARTKDNDILPKLDISQRTGKSDNSPKRTENSPRKEFGSPIKLNASPPKKGIKSPLKAVKLGISQRTRKSDNSPKKAENISRKEFESNGDIVPKLNSSPRKLNNNPPKKSANSSPKAQTEGNDTLQGISHLTDKSDKSPKKKENSPRKELEKNGDNVRKLDILHRTGSPSKNGIVSPTKTGRTNNVIMPTLSPKMSRKSSPSKAGRNKMDNLTTSDSSHKKAAISPPKTRKINNDNVQMHDIVPSSTTNDSLPKPGNINNNDNTLKLDSIDESADKATKVTNSPTRQRIIGSDIASPSGNSPKKSNNVQIELVEEKPNTSNSENIANNGRNVIIEVDKLINLIRDARDNLAHAEVELGVSEAGISANDCWVSDEQFKQFLNGAPIEIDLLPLGDANNMHKILDNLLERREYYLENLYAHNSNLIHRMNSLIGRVDRAHKYLVKAEGPFYSPKTRKHSYAVLDGQLFEKFLEGKKISHKFLPRGGAACLEALLDNLIKRREMLKHGGDGLLGERKPIEPIDNNVRYTGEKYGKSQSLPNGNGTNASLLNEIEFNKSKSMPTTGTEYERRSSERSRSYGRSSTGAEEDSNAGTDGRIEQNDQESKSPTWMDTARGWSGWMTNKLSKLYNWNKAEDPEQSMQNETTSPKMGKQNSPKNNKDENIIVKHSPRRTNEYIEAQQKPNVHDNTTKRNNDKISPPQNPRTPGPAPSQRPQITISPDSPTNKSTPKSPINGRSRAHASHSSDPIVATKNAEKIVPKMTKSRTLDHQNAETTIGLNKTMAHNDDSVDDVHLLSTSVRDLAGNFDLLRLGKITDSTINHNHEVQLPPIVNGKERNPRSPSRKSQSPAHSASPPPPPRKR